MSLQTLIYSAPNPFYKAADYALCYTCASLVNKES